MAVVLNYKNYQDTLACLDSLSRITYPNLDIVVVDNASGNDSLAHVQRYCEQNGKPVCLTGDVDIESSDRLPASTVLLQSSRNGGYAAGNNLGIRVALKRGAAYILILNSDVEVDAGFLEPLVRHAGENPRLGAVGPKVLNPDGSIARACARRRPRPWAYFFYFGFGRLLFPRNRWVKEYYYLDEYVFDQPREVDILSGCCMLLRADAIQRAGLLDENTFLLQEEVILHEKFRTLGIGAAVVPDSVIIHKHGGSTSTAPSLTVLNARRNSMIYYLSRYRSMSRGAIFLIMLSAMLPLRLFRWWRRWRRPGRDENGNPGVQIS